MLNKIHYKNTGESDKNHEDKDKYLLEEVLEKFNKHYLYASLGISRLSSELYPRLYLKELCDDYGIEPVFTHIVNLKREPLKKFENDLDFFPFAKFIIMHH